MRQGLILTLWSLNALKTNAVPAPTDKELFAAFLEGNGTLINPYEASPEQLRNGLWSVWMAGRAALNEEMQATVRALVSCNEQLKVAEAKLAAIKKATD